jgi:hypothetical protein
MRKAVRSLDLLKKCCAGGFALICALASGSVSRAEVRVEGTPAVVRITTSEDKISEVLSALSVRFNVQVQTSVQLDTVARKLYVGDLNEVVGRLLDGYNYVIKTKNGVTEILILGKRGEVALPANQTAEPPTASQISSKSESNILARWR